MFVASKFEDIYPLKMKIVFEKIGHKKLSTESIKQMELELLKTLHYKIAAPTLLEFLRFYLKQVFDIDKQSIGLEPCAPEHPQKVLKYRLAIYLSKLTQHDYKLNCLRPSLLAIACIFVTLKIVEQLKHQQLLVP